MIIPQMICESHVWLADNFWKSVHIATTMVEGQLTFVTPTTEEIEQMILRSWLDYAYPAGTA